MATCKVIYHREFPLDIIEYVNTLAEGLRRTNRGDAYVVDVIHDKTGEPLIKIRKIGKG